MFGIFLGFFAYDYAWYVFLTWLPSYLKDERKFTTSEMGIYSATPLVAMSIIIILAGVISDWLVKRGRDERFVRKAFIIAGLAIGCLIVPAGMVADKMTAVWLVTISLWVGTRVAEYLDLDRGSLSKKIVGTVRAFKTLAAISAALWRPLTRFIA